MKQIKILLLLMLTLAIALTSLTSCEAIEGLGINMPDLGDIIPGLDKDTDDENGETNSPEDDKPNPEDCGHFVTKTVGKVAPTCTAEGYTGDVVCYSCGTVVKAGTAIEKAAHTFVNGKCSVCGEEDDTDTSAIINEWKSKYECITIAEALELCEQFVESASTDRYYIVATVKSVDDESYGQLTIEDETGSIMVYGTYSSDGELKYSEMGVSLKAGDLILIHGTLQNYNGNTKEVKNARLIDHCAGKVVPPSILPGSTITIADAIALAGSTGANDRYYISATVTTVTNAAYGAMIIEDETGSISIYNSANADGSVGYADMEDKPYKGDTVLVYATIQSFNGEPELKSAYIIEFEHADISVDEDDYTEMTVSEARAAEEGALIKTKGVVARITYANGYKPSGFFLIDGTSSIYVYDGDAAARLKVGNTVTILSTKDYWILESETSNASKYGYEGCNQLTSVYLLNVEETVSDYDKSWITDSTVRDIINTPFTEDITTLVYKVTALVKEVPGAGFTNYYFFDLDGETGSYTYTQCSGGDFEWVKQFDGKICTVYLTAINAKSTSSGCNWRFIPIEIIDEGFTFDPADAPEFVLDCHVKGQFTGTYTADPALELITSVSSELLGFEGVTVSYESSDEDVVKFNVTSDGKVIFNLVSYGEAKINVTVRYGNEVANGSIDVKFEAPVEYDYVTVAEAIAAELGSTVTVKGIVGPSLVNQSGFYLIDESGLIAVTLPQSALADVELGQLVILTGTRNRKVKTDDAGNPYDCHGQTQIMDCTILHNYYGNHEYSDDKFVTDLTIEEFYDLDETKDYTTTVFVLKAYIHKAGYSYKIGNADGSVLSNLYSSSTAQYDWLADYAGQEITVELAACNWNSKSYYAGCVLSIILEDGTKVYNTLNFDNN